MKIALWLPNWLGDLVMATPAIRAVRRRFADAELVGIVRPNLATLLDGTAWLDRRRLFHPRAAESGLRRLALLKWLRVERFDLTILFPNSLHAAALAWLGGVRRRVGYARDARGWLLTDAVRLPQDDKSAVVPMVDYYLGLARRLGCTDDSRRLELRTTAAEEAVGQSVWQNLGLRGDGRVVAMNPGASYTSARRWPDEHFAVVAQWIVDRLDHDVLVTCGPSERQTARRVVELARRARVFSMADQPIGPLDAAKACVARARLMVSTDSGLRHMAAGFNKPVVTICGPTEVGFLHNPTVTSAEVQLKLPCVPCRKAVCPLKHGRCLAELPPPLVFGEVERLLNEAARRAA